MKYFTLIAAILVLSGCAGSPARLGMMDDAELDNQGVAPLCHAYAFSKHKNQKIRATLVRRDEFLATVQGEVDPMNENGGKYRAPFTAREWEAIDNAKIFVGMSEAALLCSWGSPTKVNTSGGSWGTSHQWIWTTQGFYGEVIKVASQSSYVYTKNGYVEGWQN